MLSFLLNVPAFISFIFIFIGMIWGRTQFIGWMTAYNLKDYKNKCGDRNVFFVTICMAGGILLNWGFFLGACLGFYLLYNFDIIENRLNEKGKNTDSLRKWSDDLFQNAINHTTTCFEDKTLGKFQKIVMLGLR